MVQDLMKIAEEQVTYMKSAPYNDKDRTKAVRDRVNDNMNSQMNGVHGAVIGGGVGLGSAIAQSKVTSKIVEKASPEIKEALKELSKNINHKAGKYGDVGKLAGKVLTNRSLRRAVGWTGAIAAGARAGYLPGRTIGDMASLEKKSRKNLKREPTEDEYTRVAKFSNNGKENLFASKYLDSPSALTQSNKRKSKAIEKKANYQNTRKAVKQLLESLPSNKKIINGTTIGSGVLGAVAGESAVNKVTPEEDKHRNLKRVGGAIVGGVTGGFVGNRYAKNLTNAKDFIIESAKEGEVVGKKAKDDLLTKVKEELEKRKGAGGDTIG